jgi:hypothetical protein
MTSSRANSGPIPAGRPRLVVATGGAVTAGTPAAFGIEHVVPLRADLVTLGSADSQTIRVPSAEPAAAELRWDPESDDWLFSALTAGGSLVDGARAVGWSLHHGDRVRVGDVTFVFQRDEAPAHPPHRIQNRG